MSFLTRTPDPVEGCGRRRWSGLRRVVGDFDHGCPARVPPHGTFHLRWHMCLTCCYAFSGRPRTTDPGEKTSLNNPATPEQLFYACLTDPIPAVRYPVARHTACHDLTPVEYEQVFYGQHPAQQAVGVSTP